MKKENIALYTITAVVVAVLVVVIVQLNGLNETLDLIK